MVILEVSGLEGLVTLIFGLWLVPPIILIIIGLAYLNKNKDTSKGLFITAIVYFLVCLGICGGMFI